MIVVSSFWLIFSAGLVLYEWTSINLFDQFDEPLPTYSFYQWSPRDLLANTEATRTLETNWLKVIAFLLLPIVVLWLIALSTLWVRNGFNEPET
jgi:hypothetical protein